MKASPLHALALGISIALSGCAGAHVVPMGEMAAPGQAQSLFNGTDLTGWNGDPRFWRVENGEIIGQTSEDNVVRENSFLIYTGPPVSDFKLSLDFKLTGGNSGVQYRSWINEGWSVGGYQADMDGGNRYTGMLYEERGRGIVARRGQQVVIEPDGSFNVVGQVGDTAALRKSIDMSDWNHYEISMVGNHIVHKVNGHVTVDVVDNQPEERADSGVIALQIHMGDPMKIEYKNIVLTRLAPGADAR